jgi:glycosyltransferase involved in cell wall biosynthesis
MKVSLIFTILNEASTIQRLLDSIDAQTRQPDEVVVVDAGSSDSTPGIIASWSASTEFRVQFILEPGANISRGRNAAIEAASHDVIAVTDGGCALGEAWLEAIVRPIEAGEAEVVYGMTIPIGHTPVGRVFAAFYAAKTARSDRSNTEHSSRSVAFTRRAWSAVGGYPEWLTLAGEDTLFFIRLEDTAPSALARDAAVSWEHGTETLGQIYRVHRRNSIGSGEANMWPSRYALLFLLYGGGIVLGVTATISRSIGLAALLAVGGLALWSRGLPGALRASAGPRALYLLPLIMAARDMGMLVGYLVGRRNRMSRRAA